MTIRRRPRPQWRRRVTALLASAAIIYVVAATAASTDFSSAWEILGKQGQLALSILRGQLEGMWSGGTLPAGAALAIGQSPVLLSGREAVLELRRTEEEDDSAPPGAGKPADGEEETGGAQRPDSRGALPGGDAAGVCGQRGAGQDADALFPGGICGDGGCVHQQPVGQEL